MRWVCVVIMWNLQIRIEKSFSYSISYSYSNLKVPIVGHNMLRAFGHRVVTCWVLLAQI